MRLARTANNDAKRVALADSELKSGNISAACLIYARLAKRRSETNATRTAQHKLQEIADEAAIAVEAVDNSLLGLRSVRASEHATRIRAAFAKYEDLLDDYRHHPKFGSDLRRHVRQQRNRPEFAVALNEPEANQLLTAGQQYERAGSLCCAYRTYEKAARLGATPSAMRAAVRLEELQQDTELAQAVADCKEVERCRELYARAQRVAAVNPTRGRQMLRSIVERAPSDSAVSRAARAALLE